MFVTLILSARSISDMKYQLCYTCRYANYIQVYSNFKELGNYELKKRTMTIESKNDQREEWLYTVYVEETK